MSDTTNPLLRLGFRIPFDQIQAAHVVPAIEALIARARSQLDAISSRQGERTFSSTLGALDDATEALDTAMSVVGHLESVATYPELRDAYNAVQGPVSEFYTGIFLSEPLYGALKAYSQTEEARGLTGARKRFLEKTLADFRRQGAELGAAGKERLRALDVELTQLTTKFSQNVVDATKAFELMIEDERKLAGLPERAAQAARADAESKGKKGWRFSLQAPSYVAVMTYLAEGAIREHMYRAYARRAASGDLDNTPLVDRILELRREKAALLRFADFSDLVLDDRMAKTGKRAWAFVEDLTRKTRAAFERENRELLEFRRKLEGSSAPPLEPWDTAYYAEKMRQALYDFDEEALRPYFPFGNVLEGLFAVAHRLYGVKVEPAKDLPVWHPGARTFSVSDPEGNHLGSFYTDFFPRESKRDGAWMNGLVTGRPEAGRFTPHLGLICGNLTPPVGERPSLLTHHEVSTIFHEFGHLLHHLLSRVEIRSLAGTNVAWDFVELPSQIMENWTWEREALDLFAGHYLSGEKIPGDLLQKMLRARNFRSANAQMRQLGFATVDLSLHTRYDPARDGEALSYARKILQGFTAAPLPEDYAMLCSFGHLFASPVGYAAGYYSYKWAEVLDADAFTRFRKEGILNPQVGAEFRSRVLSQGNADDPMNLYRSFMGREPDPEALLERSGL